MLKDERLSGRKSREGDLVLRVGLTGQAVLVLLGEQGVLVIISRSVTDLPDKRSVRSVII